MNKPLCLVMAPVATQSGYGARSRDLVTALLKLDKYDIKIFPTAWGSTPHSALSQDDPEHAETLTSSDFAKKVFEACVYDQVDPNTQQKTSELKVQKPIEVLLEGVRLDKYHYTKEVHKTVDDSLSNVKEKFCFLFTGHWLKGDIGADRKNVGMLVRTFLETYKNKAKHNQPALILKTSGADTSPVDKEGLMDKLGQVYNSVTGTNLPNVYLLHGELTDEEMNSLYNHPKVKAHITFTRGEGFGRPLAEAALSQKPVIATNYSAHTEFLKEAILLPGTMENIHPSAVWDKVIVPQSQWFTVDYGYASSMMKHIVDNYKDYEIGAKKQATLIKKEWNFDTMVDKLESILDNRVPDFPHAVEVALKMPQIKKIELPKLKKVEAE